MSLSLYTDVHVRRAIVVALQVRGVQVLTAQADGTAELDDSSLLDRSTVLGRVLFTQDEDLLREATLRHRSGKPFADVIYAHQLRIGIGQCINDLEVIAKTCEPPEFADRVEHLPLK